MADIEKLKTDIDAIVEAGGTDEDVIKFLKSSGVEFSFSNKDSSDVDTLEQVNLAEERVQQRGSSTFTQRAKDVRDAFSGGSKIEKVMSSLAAISEPGRRLVSMLSNPILEAQKGNLKDVPESILQGALGLRRGEVSDVLVATGVPELPANVTGFLTEAVGGGIVANKALKAISGSKILKFGDKAAIKGVADLEKGVDSAVVASKKLTNKMWEPIDNIPANPQEVSAVLEKLPKNAVEFLELKLGSSVDDILSNPKGVPLSILRKIKQSIGQIKQSAFSKEGSVVSNALENEKAKRGYGAVVKLIRKTLVKNGKGRDVITLMEVDDVAEGMAIAQNITKRAITKSTGEKSVASLVRKSENLAGVSFRTKLETLKGGGKAHAKATRKAISKESTKEFKNAARLMNKGLDKLRNIGFHQALGKFTRGALKSAVFGGVAGGVIGQSLRGGIRGALGGESTNTQQ